MSFIYVRTVSEKPIRMRRVNLTDAHIAHCRLHQVEPALEAIAGAIESKKWPDYQPLDVELPEWMEARDSLQFEDDTSDEQEGGEG